MVYNSNIIQTHKLNDKGKTIEKWRRKTIGASLEYSNMPASYRRKTASVGLCGKWEVQLMLRNFMLKWSMLNVRFHEMLLEDCLDEAEKDRIRSKINHYRDRIISSY